MKISLSVIAALALLATARPASAEGANAIFAKLEAALSGPQSAAAKEKALKNICQKGNAFGGTFGLCRSGEGIVCGFKQEAFALCSIICGDIGKNYQGFNDSKCVTKHGSKFDFNGQTKAQWIAAKLGAKAKQNPQLAKVCNLIKTHGAKVSQLKPLVDACQ
jgi:hypothetical protein